MVGFTIKIEGLKELDQRRTELGTVEARRVVRDALRQGGEVFRSAVADGVPSKWPARSAQTTALPLGALKNDIQLHIGLNGEGLPAAIIKPGKWTAHVARFLEYGHRLVKGGNSRMVRDGYHRGPGTQLGDVPETPFIRPAYEAMRATAVDVTVFALVSGIEEAAEKRKVS
jgi:HK97 gp10 family phage protein